MYKGSGRELYGLGFSAYLGPEDLDSRIWYDKILKLKVCQAFVLPPLGLLRLLRVSAFGF